VFLINLQYNDENTIKDSHEIFIYDIPYVLAIRDAKISGKHKPKGRLIKSSGYAKKVMTKI
jgi:hypothetical protein